MIPRPTLQSAATRLNQTIKRPAGRLRALSEQEDRTVRALLAEYANKRIPMDSLHVRQAVKYICFPHDARKKSSVALSRGTPRNKLGTIPFVRRQNKFIEF